MVAILNVEWRAELSDTNVKGTTQGPCQPNLVKFGLNAIFVIKICIICISAEQITSTKTRNICFAMQLQ